MSRRKRRQSPITKVIRVHFDERPAKTDPNPLNLVRGDHSLDSMVRHAARNGRGRS